MYHLACIIEQTLGHITHGLNLQQYIARDPTIQADWCLPAWERDGLWGKTPLLRSNWTLQAGMQSRKYLARLSRRSRIDVLFFHTQVTAVLCPDWLGRIPSVVSLDATPRQYDRLGAYYHHPAGPVWLEHWKWRLNHDCFRLARHIVTWSAWARDGLVDEYEVPFNKIRVIPPGVDTQAWARPHRQVPHPGIIRILFVGGNLNRKGGGLLLDAFRRLRDQFEAPSNYSERTSLELHLVTRDTVVPEPGVFVYQMMKPNSMALKALFFESDIFCLPTMADCLPMVLSEAGAAGLPAVSTGVAAIPEIIQDGETGFLVPPADLEALTAALQRLILNRDLRLNLGHQAEQVVRNKFDAEQNAARLLGLIKETSERSREKRTAH